MSKHRMVNGKLLQMNKSYGQLKQKQKVKITEWMYQAYKRQAVEGLSDEAALQIVMEKIEQAGLRLRGEISADTGEGRGRARREQGQCKVP